MNLLNNDNPQLLRLARIIVSTDNYNELLDKCRFELQQAIRSDVVLFMVYDFAQHCLTAPYAYNHKSQWAAEQLSQLNDNQILGDIYDREIKILSGNAKPIVNTMQSEVLIPDLHP